MAAMTDYLENKLIDWLFRGQSFTPPATWYVSLYTGTPTDDNGGGLTEVSGGSYARAAYVSSLSNWNNTQETANTDLSSGDTGVTSNNNDVTFPAPTADWGTVTWFGLCDASSGGHALFLGELTDSREILNGDTAPKFPAASLLYSIDG